MAPPASRTMDEFVRRLAALRGGLTYDSLARKSAIGKTHINDVFSRRTLLEATAEPEKFVRAIVEACPCDEDPEAWIAAYRETRERDPWGGMRGTHVEVRCLARWLRGLIDEEHAYGRTHGLERVERAARRVEELSGEECPPKKLLSWLNGVAVPPKHVVEAIVRIGTPGGERSFRLLTRAALMRENATRPRTTWPRDGGEQLAATYDDLILTQVAKADLEEQVKAGTAVIRKLESGLATARSARLQQAEEFQARLDAANRERDLAIEERKRAEETLRLALDTFRGLGGATKGLADPARVTAALRDAGRATAELSAMREVADGDLTGARERLLATPRRSMRARLWISGALAVLLVVAIVLVINRSTAPPPAGEAFSIATADGGRRLAVEQNADHAGAAVHLVDPAERHAVVQLVSAARDQPEYRHLRVAGKVLMCLGEIGNRGVLGQDHCGSAVDLYWKSRRAADGALQMVNLDGKCLTRAAENRLELLGCDAGRTDQAWRAVRPVELPAVPTPGPQAPGEPKREEFALGGQDKPCAPQPGDRAVKDVTWASWQEVSAEEKIPRDVMRKIADEEPHQRRATHVEMGAAISADLYRANLKTGRGTEETFFWAQAWGPGFTPDRFQLHLQWTPVEGPGGWHTCSTPLDRATKTVALPRRPGNDGRKIQFRVCVTYQPEAVGIRPGQTMPLVTACSLPRY